LGESCAADSDGGLFEAEPFRGTQEPRADDGQAEVDKRSDERRYLSEISTRKLISILHNTE